MSTAGKAHDGGFGWVIVTASFMAQVFQFGIVWTVGVFYVIFLDNISGSEPAIALISSLNTAVCFGTGPVAGLLTSKYGHRLLVVTGGFVGCLGLFLSAFSKNVFHLYLTFGALTGFGFGLAYVPSIGIVALYFEKRRTIAFGLAASGVGLGTFLFPHLIRFLVDSYGWRGALVMLSGICLNMCVCGALMRPSTADGATKSPGAEKRSDETKTVPKDETSLVNLSIFRNAHYFLLCLNNVLFCFGLSVIYVHLSAYAESIGFTKSQGASLFSILGISNFIGRIIFGLLAHIPAVDSTLLYLSAQSSVGVVTVFVPLASSYAGLLAWSGLFGFLSAAFGTLLPQVILKTLNLHLMPTGYGCILVFEAIGTLLGGPAAGWLYSSTQLYAATLCLGGGFLIVSGVLMLFPWRHPHKHADEDSQVIEVKDGERAYAGREGQAVCRHQSPRKDHAHLYYDVTARGKITPTCTMTSQPAERLRLVL